MNKEINFVFFIQPTGSSQKAGKNKVEFYGVFGLIIEIKMEIAIFSAIT